MNEKHVSDDEQMHAFLYFKCTSKLRESVLYNF